MRHIRPREFSDEDFQKVFDYFANEVFTKKDQLNIIIEDSIKMLGFIELFKNKFTHKSSVDNPYYGVIKNCGSTGLSYEFMNTINNGTKNIELVKGWKHAWYGAYYDYLLNGRDDKHGYPYYEYKINVIVIDGFLNYSKEEVERNLNWDRYKITRYLSRQIERMAIIHDPKMNVEARVKCYDKNYNDYFTFEITITDKDYNPKNVLNI